MEEASIGDLKLSSSFPSKVIFKSFIDAKLSQGEEQREWTVYIVGKYLLIEWLGNKKEIVGLLFSFIQGSENNTPMIS